MRWLATIFLIGGLTACSFGPAARETPTIYDLGAPRPVSAGVTSIHASVLMHNIEAPFWLDTSAIIYRMNGEAGRQQTYSSSRWAASPAALLTQLLRDRLARASSGGVVSAADGVRADYILRVELEDFSQVFDRADSSHGVVVARASLIDAAHRTLLTQKDFTFEQAADTQDASGGVRALTEASDNLLDAVVAWAASKINAGGQ